MRALLGSVKQPLYSQSRGRSVGVLPPTPVDVAVLETVVGESEVAAAKIVGRALEVEVESGLWVTGGLGGRRTTYVLTTFLTTLQAGVFESACFASTRAVRDRGVNNASIRRNVC